MVKYFISDLHLSDERPDLIRAFTLLMDSIINEKDNESKDTSIYILGDFYDSWIGDDHQPYWNKEIEDVLFKVIHHGIDLIFFHGNRDFLLDSKWANRIGAKLVTEHLIIEELDCKILLSHGDEACLDDIDYQKFRSMVRKKSWQKDFLATPLTERLSIAKELRTKSKSMKSEKILDIMDVNPKEIMRLMSTNHCRLMIHGHTHRPALHIEKEGFRVVLGDWNTHVWFGVLKDDNFKQFKVALGELVTPSIDMDSLIEKSSMAQELSLSDC